MHKHKNTVVTLTGPTCSGKSYLARSLKRRGIPEIRSFTTRAPRQGEQDGVQYDFMTKDQVEAIPSDQIIELVTIAGNYYGNTIGQLERAFEECEGVVTVVVDPTGVGHWAAAAKKFGFNHYSIFLEQRPEILIERFTRERLAKASPDRIPYEVERLTHMLEVEVPTWRKRFDYELVVPNLGASLAYSDFTEDMIFGFLSISFANR